MLRAYEVELGKHGYIVGRNVVIEIRSAEGDLARLPNLAAELVALKVDVIVATNPAAAVAAKQAAPTTAIVFSNVTDPVAMGLVASLAKPGGNLTGLSFEIDSDIVGKQLELLKELNPHLPRVAALWNSANPGSQRYVSATQVAAQSLGVMTHLVDVGTDVTDIDRVLSRTIEERVGGIVVLPDPVTRAARKTISDFALRHRLPTVYGFKEMVDREAGGLLAYGPSVDDVWPRQASYVRRILSGAKPGDIPVEQPTRFYLVINLKTARALGLTIPPSLLARADQVIE
jgi:ABC-type uncharacterized transport system substrate-binding protein